VRVGCQRAVDVGQLIWQQNAGGFIGAQILTVSAVALPAVGRRPQRRRTADHVTVAALLADATAGNVIHHNPVPSGESTATGTDRNHLTAWLVPGNDTPVRLKPTTQMLRVDRADIAAADRRCLHLQQHLSMSWLWDIHLNMLGGAMPGRTTPLILAMMFLLRSVRECSWVPAHLSIMLARLIL
jgi:hypothetical protein